MTTYLRTTSSSTIQQDPVQGLVDYVLDIKPYHTKIVEVLIEYIHTDPINVTIAEDFKLGIDAEMISITPAYDCGFGVVYDPAAPSTFYPIVSYDGTYNTFTVAGNYTSNFVYGYPFVVSGTGTDDRIFHVLASIYDSGTDTTTIN